ncbi:MAG TPA: hypothetical protein VE843_12155, partial [Ktedonobacteraceae bacterium]|nr:hypothetical protein [Ktedonobacteraceae bacterium]
MSSESGEDEAAENIHKADALPTSPLLIVSSPKNTPSQISSSLSGIDVSEEENLAEELPTNPYMTSFSQIAAVNHSSSSPGIDFDNRSMSHDQVEDIATRPYAAQPRNLSQEVGKLVQNQQGHAVQTPPVYMNSPAVERPVTPVPLSLPQSQLPPFQSATQTPPGTMPVAPLPEPKKSTRKRFIIGLGLLFVLLIGGIIAWVILAQPFTVPEITRTTQNFTDTSLGVSLQYPRNWTVAINKQARTVHLYDANHTDQVNITVVVASNQNMNQYVSKTVSTLGITGQRTLSQASFAGATWQRIQGSVQQNGANYTATILVTMR